MILTMDIGNTNIKTALFDGKEMYMNTLESRRFEAVLMNARTVVISVQVCFVCSSNNLYSVVQIYKTCTTFAQHL